MKKNYIQPIVEVMTVNATYSICAESTFESFSILDHTGAEPISAGDGR